MHRDLVHANFFIHLFFSVPKLPQMIGKSKQHLLQAQSLHGWYFKKLIFKMSEFGASKGLLTKKGPAWESGALEGSSNPS